MDKIGQIEIRVTETVGNIELTPDNYDIREIQLYYDANYLSNLREKAKMNWLGNIDADIWLKELREGYNVL